MKAGQAARAALMAVLTLDGQDFSYPLGWAQLALYHRGPNRPLCKPQTSTARPGRYHRQETTVSGLPVLTFGFIGRRREQHAVRRAYRDGQRLFVLQGLGGLGKTALASRLVSQVLTTDAADAAILRCKELQDAPAPLVDLWAQVEQIGKDHDLEGWEAACTECRERLRQSTAAAGLRETIKDLWTRRPNLVLTWTTPNLCRQVR